MVFHLCFPLSHGSIHLKSHCSPEEAKECMADTSGRWYRFAADMSTVVVIERKGLPAHLTSMSRLEKPSLLSDVLKELQDMGEVRLKYKTNPCKFWRPIIPIIRSLLIRLYKVFEKKQQLS